MSKKIPRCATGLKRIYKAFLYSLSGLKLAYKDEAAFRQELLLAVVLTVLCLVLPLESWLRIALISSHALVLITELLNTAVEAVVNKTSPEYHEDAKKAKDTGSSAVLIALFLAAGLWCYALWTLFVH
ncbi:MAG: diacylglycerol kinase [Gammaproteobacteria bacterium]|nr:diacylglycerol kinase [Gammaproteobacteria bacterium]MYD75569.1 diacylglycerol kinase [Gammaproteobacteria bacterium]MYJ51208.1 diacylglycerol kinase [Gammaproteobacteria bacterium]